MTRLDVKKVSLEISLASSEKDCVNIELDYERPEFQNTLAFALLFREKVKNNNSDSLLKASNLPLKVEVAQGRRGGNVILKISFQDAVRTCKKEITFKKMHFRIGKAIDLNSSIKFKEDKTLLNRILTYFNFKQKETKEKFMDDETYFEKEMQNFAKYINSERNQQNHPPPSKDIEEEIPFSEGYCDDTTSTNITYQVVTSNSYPPSNSNGSSKIFLHQEYISKYEKLLAQYSELESQNLEKEKQYLQLNESLSEQCETLRKQNRDILQKQSDLETQYQSFREEMEKKLALLLSVKSSPEKGNIGGGEREDKMSRENKEAGKRKGLTSLEIHELEEIIKKRKINNNGELKLTCNQLHNTPLSSTPPVLQEGNPESPILPKIHEKNLNSPRIDLVKPQYKTGDYCTKDYNEKRCLTNPDELGVYALQKKENEWVFFSSELKYKVNSAKILVYTHKKEYILFTDRDSLASITFKHIVTHGEKFWKWFWVEKKENSVKICWLNTTEKDSWIENFRSHVKDKKTIYKYKPNSDCAVFCLSFEQLHRAFSERGIAEKELPTLSKDTLCLLLCTKV